MKKNLHFISLLFVFLLATWFSQVNAQTVVISYANDSSFAPHCPPPFVTNMDVFGTATGYATNDSVDIHINFGDGTDSAVRVPIISGSLYFYTDISHSYFASGQYSVEYIATGPDGAADTVINYSQIIVGDSCGNVSGTVYIDNNSNCIYDAGDTPMRWRNVELLSGPDVVDWSYTDSLGNYYFNVPIGFPYTIRLGNYNNNLATDCPASGTYSIATAPSSGNDFAVSCTPGYNFTGGVWGWNLRPNGQQGDFWVHAENLYCEATSGQAQFILDPSLTVTSIFPTPASVNGDTITWDLNNLSNNIFSLFWSNFNAYVEVLTSPGATIGDTLCFKLTEESVAGDADPTNNVQQICYAIHSSWDPNEKAVVPAGLGQEGRIAPSVIKPMDYTIHFQNTGNDVAHDVFIMDTISSNLDINTFQVLASSHAMDVDIFPGNIVRFSFNNIMLPDSGANQAASNGFVSYTVNQKAGLTNGTLINNTGAIYFDFNAPVMTNTTINTIDEALEVSTLSQFQNPITVYPNPASTQLTIVSGQLKINSIEIHDVLGQKVYSRKMFSESRETIIDISALNPGIYFVKVSGEKTERMVKFVRE